MPENLRAKMIKVKLISTQGAAAIIEHQSNNGPERAIVPNEAVKGGRIAKKDLDTAIPFGGIELADYGIAEQLTINIDDLQKLFRERGLWTEEDYLSSPQVILGALQKLYGLDTTAILNAIKVGKNDNDLQE